MRTASVSSRLHPDGDSQLGPNCVIACVDHSKHVRKVVSHAIAIASALRVPVTLLRVLDTPPAEVSRPDPVEWDIRRQESRSALKELAEAHAGGMEGVAAEVVEGQTAKEICRCARERSAELIVLGTHGERQADGHGIGATAREVLERAAGAVLLVPVSTALAHTPPYRRILVPLDGSSWSESVLPLALRLTHALGAELILVYVVPVPELIEADPLEAEDLELRERLIDRNEKVARSYLDRIRGRAAEQGIRVRALTLRGDDIRSSLIKYVDSERVELVVLSGRGHGRTRVSDVPYGNVAGYMITHSPVPILIVRPTEPPSNTRDAAKLEAGRPPIRPVA